jgi:hypothetical protein
MNNITTALVEGLIEQFPSGEITLQLACDHWSQFLGEADSVIDHPTDGCYCPTCGYGQRLHPRLERLLQMDVQPESTPCDRGTPGCSVGRHVGDSRCETW